MDQEDIVEKEPPVAADDGKVTVEVAEEKGKPRLTDEEVAKLADVPAEDEISRYAKDAQKRIKNLHIAGDEWRRRAAQSSRDASTATTLAEQLYRENQELKANMGRSEAALIDQAIQRAEAQLVGARTRAKAAYAAQDPDAIVAANEEVARFVSEADRLRLLKPASAATTPAGAAADGAPAASAGPPVAPAPRPVSEGTKAWMAKNPWFGKAGEEEATGFALGVHQTLERQGVTEENNPTEYWATINKRLKEVYPERFKTAAPTRPVTVTGGTRVNGDTPPLAAGRKHVVLSESQVRIAKALGLTNEQYATQLVKEEREREKTGATIQ
jgi:hypothetical protein